MVRTKSEIFEILKKVPDPEIPVLTILDLGMVRDVEIEEDKTKVIITPTYSGCPAMDMIEVNIKSVLQDHQIENVEIETVLKPVWTTDWISEEAREKLRKYGIAPPMGKSSDKQFLLGHQKNVPCPQCNLTNTELVSQFGSTPCKSLYKCLDCKELFDYFKCH